MSVAQQLAASFECYCGATPVLVERNGRWVVPAHSDANDLPCQYANTIVFS